MFCFWCCFNFKIFQEFSQQQQTDPTDSSNPAQQLPYRERWVWMLLTCICSPYLFTLFDSILKALFSSKPWPTIKIIVLILCVETAHSFGVSIFVFRVLPKLDVARGILLMNAVCTVPCLLKLFLSKTNRNSVSALKRLIIFILDAVALLMQCSVFGIVYASKFMFNEQNKQQQQPTQTTQPAGNNSNDLETVEAAINNGDPFSDSLVVARNKRNLVEDILNETISYLSSSTTYLHEPSTSSTIATATSTTPAISSSSSSSFSSSSTVSSTIISSTLSFVNTIFIKNNDTFKSSSLFPSNSQFIQQQQQQQQQFIFNQSSTASNQLNMEEVITSFQIDWEFPIALMLVSLIWWENFFDRDIKLCTYKLVNMKLLKDNITATRCKTNMLSSIWKIGITILFAYIFNPTIFTNTSLIFKSSSNGGVDLNGAGMPNDMWNNGANGNDPFFMQPPPQMPLIAKRSIENNSTTASYSKPMLQMQFMPIISSFSTLPNLIKSATGTAAAASPFDQENDMLFPGNIYTNYKNEYI